MNHLLSCSGLFLNASRTDGTIIFEDPASLAVSSDVCSSGRVIGSAMVLLLMFLGFLFESAADLRDKTHVVLEPHQWPATCGVSGSVSGNRCGCLRFFAVVWGLGWIWESRRFLWILDGAGVEPPGGIEPPTCRLRIGCSTS